MSGSWQHATDTTETHLSACVIDYGLNLFSNLTYCLADPDRGDQFEQEDRRRLYGGEAHRHRFGSLGSVNTQHTAGLQLRCDDIEHCFASRQAGEAAGGIDHRHFHPVEPVQQRLSLTLPF